MVTITERSGFIVHCVLVVSCHICDEDDFLAGSLARSIIDTEGLLYMCSRISSVKRFGTCVRTNIFGNIGCRPHNEIDEEPLDTGSNMDLSHNVPVAQDVAENLDGASDDFDYCEAPNNIRTHNDFSDELESHISWLFYDGNTVFGFESLLQVHGNQGDLPDSDNDSGISKENNFFG